jgi:hypothetical protein
MKANKKTLMAVKSYFENREGWDIEELIDDCTRSTKLLKDEEIGELSLDECDIVWDGKSVCLLCGFIEAYTEQLLNCVCNVLDSFVDEDLNEYLEED